LGDGTLASNATAAGSSGTSIALSGNGVPLRGLMMGLLNTPARCATVGTLKSCATESRILWPS
jgi:hypothetical protein